jgi:hypothetical protein
MGRAAIGIEADFSSRRRLRMPVTGKNHYVPELYLKHFAADAGRLYRYRTLVSYPRVPEWKPLSIGGVGYQRHLYTRALADRDSDEIEQWLNHDFESPAADSISRAVNDKPLSKEDYRLMVRFAVAQSMRTPAFLVRHLPGWRKETQLQLEETSRKVKQDLKRAHLTGERLEHVHTPNSEYLPLRFTRVPSSDGKSVVLRTETVVGRVTWIHAMRHLLTSTIKRLPRHHWTILSAEDDLPWFTTDDPVVLLRFQNSNDYDFEGGWGVPKTNIFLPLSPKHLLFTQVGERASPRGTVLPRDLSITLRRMIAEHAYRYIFSSCIDPTIKEYRPRMVDPKATEFEQEQWREWHEEQSRAEREFAK